MPTARSPGPCSPPLRWPRGWATGSHPRCAAARASLPGISADIERIAAAWALAERHGIPLADLLGRAHEDIRWRVRFAATVRAQLAGPRATAAVLTALPLLGLGLGQLIGADPIGVLRGGLLGQVLLVVGVALIAAGSAWSERILRFGGAAMTAAPGWPGPVTALLLLAAALLVAGDRSGRHRLRALHASPPHPAPEGVPVRPAWVAVGAAAAGALGWATAGAAAGLLLAAAAAGAGLLAARRARRDVALAPEPDTELAAGWELLAVCLEAGLPVAVAVTAATGPLRGAVGARCDASPACSSSVPIRPPHGAPPSSSLPSRRSPAPRAAPRAPGRPWPRSPAPRPSGSAPTLLDTAQARAQRAAVLITGPLGLCFLPAFLVLGIAPVVIGLAGEALAQW